MSLVQVDVVHTKIFGDHLLHFKQSPHGRAPEEAAGFAINPSLLPLQNMNPQPILPPRTVSDIEASNIGPLRGVLHGLVSDVHRSPRSKGHSLQLVLCIFSHNSPGLYGEPLAFCVSIGCSDFLPCKTEEQFSSVVEQFMSTNAVTCLRKEFFLCWSMLNTFWIIWLSAHKAR